MAKLGANAGPLGSATSPTAVLMRGVSKSFPGVRALHEVDFAVARGEVHALLGENGAGKSTLIKILAGAQLADTGEIEIDGRAVRLDSPAAAAAQGVSVIYQEFNLIPALSVAENICLGREPGRCRGWIDRRAVRDAAQAALTKVGLDIDPATPVRGLSIANQQLVEIARAVSVEARVLVMDEPSATLTAHELDHLFALIGKLKAGGVSVIYISHRLEEIFAIANRVTVLRDGEAVGTVATADVTRDDLIRMMVGREVDLSQRPAAAERGEPLLEVKELMRAGVLDDCSLVLHRNEIVGLTGLVGAGRTELARAIFGADPVDAGEIILDGKPVRITSPCQAVRLGIALAPEDRKQQGLVLGLSVRQNVSLSSLADFTAWGFIRSGPEGRAVHQQVESLAVRTPDLQRKVKYLSGGNQQKVVLARWLLSHARVFLFDEPTRGIDVGAKKEIHQLLRELARQGAAILMISSELPEVLAVSDRIVVMHEGRIRKSLDIDDATPETIMHYATGGE